MAEKASQDAKDSPSVPWSDAIRFIRQLSHDLRNDLNAIELQSAYIAELEKNEELQRRDQTFARNGLTYWPRLYNGFPEHVGEVKPNLISYRATDLMEDLRRKDRPRFPKEKHRNHLGNSAWRRDVER